MKKIIVFLAFVCSVFHLYAQTSQVKVTLKSGVVIKGDLKELKPTDYVIVSFGGVDSKIQMTDVESIETLSATTSDNVNKKSAESFDTKQFGKYIITDHSQLPESFEIDVNGEKIRMLLVRGGTFNMGYDGRGSLSMKSEPVHQVTLSSFYISGQCIKEEIAFKLLGKEKKSYKDRFYNDSWKNANRVAEQIAKHTNKPFRLLFEAEWEYASLMPNADQVWGTGEYLEWCSDFYAKYESGIQTNPQGPVTGSRHVSRSYRMGGNKWNRKLFTYYNATKGCCMRIAISADAINIK